MTMEDFFEMSWSAAVLILAGLVSITVGQAIAAPVQGTKRNAEVIDTAVRNYGAAQVPDYKSGRVVEDVWKLAATPKGRVSLKVLEATGETIRTDAQGFIVSKPKFTPQVKALAGKRITVAGWMMPLTAARLSARMPLPLPRRAQPIHRGLCRHRPFDQRDAVVHGQRGAGADRLRRERNLLSATAGPAGLAASN
jgi:hypothetical protein